MSLMKMESINFYKVHDIPEQIRRKMAIGTSFSTLQDVTSAIAQYGIDATSGPEFKSLLSDVATYDSTEGGFEVPAINIGANNDLSFFNENSEIYNFVAVVTVTPINTVASVEERCIIVGYTSEVSPSFGGYLPEDMKMFINDIYGLRVSYAHTPNGQRYIPENGLAIVDNFVLANALPETHSFTQGPESYVLPDNMMSIAALQNDYQVDVSQGETVTHASQFRDMPQCVSAGMVSPDQFALHATGGFLHGLQGASEVGAGFNTWGSSTSSQTSAFFRDKRLTTPLGNQKFVRVLRDHLASSGFTSRSNDAVANGAFTLADLKMCISNSHDLDMWMSASVTEAMSNIAPTMGADAWSTNTMGSLVSFDIAQRITSLMAPSLVGDIQFSFTTNNYVDGRLGVPIINPQSVRALDRNGQVPRVLLQKLRDALEYGLIATVSKNNRIAMDCVVYAALGSAVRVEIMIDGSSGMEAFTYASFMSGRTNTSTTGDSAYIQDLSHSLGKFTKAVAEGFNESHTQNLKSNIYSGFDNVDESSGLFGTSFGESNGADHGGDTFGGPNSASGNKFNF